MKKGYPLFLDLTGKSCLVFGGGRVALRKVQSLLKRGAKVTCVSKEFCRPLQLLRARHDSGRARQSRNTRLPRPNFPLEWEIGTRNDGGVLHLKRMTHHRISLNGARLVIAATSDREFNFRVARECRRRKIWVNVVDDPGLCDFTVPAVVERGPLQLAISTSGTSPLFARRLREELEKVIPVSTGKLLEKIGKARALTRFQQGRP